MQRATLGLSPRPAEPPPAQASEAELVARAAGGDGAAFEAIMRRHNGLLFRTARSILRSDADAEDALQDAYLRAWRALAGFRAEARLSTWLTRIVINEALGRLRRTSAEIIPLETAMESPELEATLASTDTGLQQPEAQVMRAQLRRLMEARIDLLPEAFRTVFMLRAVEELSVDEVAQALDIPPATVRTRFFRARGLLRESMAQAMDTALAEVFAFDGARCDRIVARVLAKARAQGLTP